MKTNEKRKRVGGGKEKRKRKRDSSALDVAPQTKRTTNAGDRVTWGRGGGEEERVTRGQQKRTVKRRQTHIHAHMDAHT